MPETPSRRQILSVAAAGAVAIALPATASAQTGQDIGVESVEKELAKPLTFEAKKLLVEALKGVDTAANDRLKTKLPENSEPCFTYYASTREVRAK